MARALILGGTGAIGRATARRLIESGWQVTVTGRKPAALPIALSAAGATFITSDRQDHDRLLASLGDAPDLLVDAVCYTAADATALLPMVREAGSTVMLSSKAVYVDAAGNHTNSDVPPHFDGPVSESQPTMAPSDIDYNSRGGYGANKIAAEQVLLDSGAPVTVLRPSKVHGAGSRRPREWMFVKRVLDSRPAVFLAAQGLGVDHTSAALNIAALIETAAAKPGRRILNSADPDAPSALEISRAIARHLNHEWEEILLDGSTPDGETLGLHAWGFHHPIVLDMTAAAAIGYTPVGDYATTVAEEIDWLVAAARGGPDASLLPRPDDEFFEELLNYEVEDAYLDRRSHQL